MQQRERRRTRRQTSTIAARGAKRMGLRRARRIRLRTVLVASALICTTLGACSYVNARSIHFVGRPDFPPTDPATVEILHRPPMRPHEVLGQVMIEPEG